MRLARGRRCTAAVKPARIEEGGVQQRVFANLRTVKAALVDGQRARVKVSLEVGEARPAHGGVHAEGIHRGSHGSSADVGEDKPTPPATPDTIDCNDRGALKLPLFHTPRNLSLERHGFVRGRRIPIHRHVRVPRLPKVQAFIVPLAAPPWQSRGQILFTDGSYFIGGLAATLSITSVLYHATHSPKVRAADVVLLWLVGLTGTVEALINIAPHGPHAGWLLGLGCIGSLCMIFISPMCHIDRDMELAMIRLPWHAGVHLISGGGLCLLAVGNASAAAFAFTLPSIGAPQPKAWAGAFIAAAILSLITSACHWLSGHKTPAKELNRRHWKAAGMNGVYCRPVVLKANGKAPSKSPRRRRGG